MNEKKGNNIHNIQKKQVDWKYQWQNFEDKEKWLFLDWIKPNKIEDFKDKRVLDAGCGGGQHTFFVAPYAKEVVAVDLNALETAKEKNKNFQNVEYVEGDIAIVDFKDKFDIVFCIGVIHHTDDPDRTFKNLSRLTKSGGKTIVWCYSYEGNFLNRTMVEWFKRVILLKINKKLLSKISLVITTLVYIPVYSLYFLPLKFLPYYEYFKNWRRLSFYRNNLNVFDKLNAPQTDFIKKERVEKWFRDSGYKDVSICSYISVSWSASGIKI